MQDLWPEDIVISAEKLKAPVTILKEQASLLGKKTQNLVEAIVRTNERMQAPERFAYDFYLVAPALSAYRYRLFTIMHGIQLYPVNVYVDRDMAAEIAPGRVGREDMPMIFSGIPGEQRELLAKSEEELLEILKKIFGAKKTKQIIQALLAQMVGYDEIETDIPF